MAIVFLLVSLAVFNLVSVLARAPEFGKLSVSNVTLTKPVEIIRPTGKGSRGPWASVQTDSLKGRIDNLCFLSECHLPLEMATLRSGDRVQIWLQGDRIWQVARDGAVLLSYEQILGAYHRAAWRRALVFGSLFIMTVVILGWIFLRRKQLALKTITVRTSFRLAATGESLSREYRGMTVNERLAAAGLIDQFDGAARRRDREGMLALLGQVGLSASSSVQTVNLILGNPSHYGF